MSSDGERKARKPLFGILKQRSEEKPEVEYVTVKEEKKKVKRVVKTKPLARKHMSEEVDTQKLSDKELQITAEVINGISSEPEAQKALEPAIPTFTCFQCGCPVPESAERCPGCNTLYVREFEEKDKETEQPAVEEFGMEFDEVFSKSNVPCMHFDTETGIINYLEKDSCAPDVEVECTNCGTLICFDAERCPICGAKFDIADTGLVSLFSGMEFDSDSSGDIECPLCGEKVVLEKGMCPSCSEVVQADNPKDPSRKVEPVIHNENVVFLHLDVSSGNVNYIQRLARKLGFEQLTVKLEGIGKVGFDKETDWKSLSRI
jgi:hypothetical protein